MASCSGGEGPPQEPLPAALEGPASSVGQWSPRLAWPDLAIQTALLPTGKVMWWPEDDSVREWDPQTQTHRDLPRVGYNIHCPGLSLLGDGQLMVTGGHVTEDVGLNDASTWNPFTGRWTRLPDMNAPRWYPTNTTLGDGGVLVAAGSISAGVSNLIPQVWQPASGSWRTLSGASRSLPTYPWMFQTGTGPVFYAGPEGPSAYLDVSGSGAWRGGPSRAGGERTFGTAVMYDVDRVLVLGGINGQTPSALATAEVIDLRAASPTWRPVGSMRSGRSNPNATLLPDGTVLVTGGTSANRLDDPSRAALEAELWSPSSGSFSPMASASEYRGYHSTAVLLPDGRVLSAGGFAQSQASAQIFSPPYLFRGARPTIASAPAAAGYGQELLVGTPEAGQITRVTLLRLAATTHAFDQNQRFLPLTFVAESGRLRVSSPPSPNQAPPGHYLLFVLNGQGVPSVARIIQLAEGAGGGGPADGGPGPGTGPDAGPDGGPVDAGADDAGIMTPDAPSGGGEVLFHDDFNRTAALGASWTVALGAFSLNGQVALGTRPSSYAVWSGSPPADATVELTVSSGGPADYRGVLARANPAAPARDHYAAYVRPDGLIGLARRDGYAYTYLGTGPALGGGAHVLSLTATGREPVVLSVRVDGREVLHVTDGSGVALASGRAGIFDYDGDSQPLDDFTVRAPGGGGPPMPGPDGGVADTGGGGVDAGGGGADGGGGSTVLFRDDFSRTGALGASWQVTFGAFGANGSSAVGTAPSSYAFWTGSPPAAVTAAVNLSAAGSPTYAGVIVRANTDAPDRDHYAAYVDPDGSIGLARRVGYEYTQLASGPALGPGTHTLSLMASGSGPVTLSVAVDGQEVLRFTDSSTQARPSGRAGIFDYDGQSHPLDAFTVRAP